MFEQNSKVVCEKVVSLINEEKFQEATNVILETDTRMIEAQKGQLVDAFLQQMRLKMVTDPKDINDSTMQEFQIYLELAEALQIEGSSPAYNVVKYINGILSLEDETKYAGLFLMFNDEYGSFSRSQDLIGNIVTDMSLYPYAEQRITDQLNELKNISFSEYGFENYGISDYQMAISKFTKAIPVFVESKFQEGKQDVTAALQKIAELADEQLESLNRISDTLNSLPVF